MEETFALGGYWPGLIIPAVIVIVGLLTAAVVLLVTRDARGVAPKRSVSVKPSGAAPEPRVSVRPGAAAERETEEAPEERGEDE